MSKTTRTLLIAGAVIVAAYLAWRWYQNRQAGGSPTGTFGTNLNSVAPELVGGSSGPTVGPAVSAPINITMNEQVAPSPTDDTSTDMIGANQRTLSPVGRQSDAARSAGLQPGNDMEDLVGGGGDTAPASEPEEPGGPDVISEPVVTPRAKPGVMKSEGPRRPEVVKP